MKSVLRRTFASGSNPVSSHTSARGALWAIIGINAAVFGAWQYSINRGDQRLRKLLNDNAMLSWSNIKAGRYWTLITSAFSHVDLVHFTFNMFALHAFGSIISFVPGVGGVYMISLAFGSAIAGSLGWLYHQRSRAQTNQGRSMSTRSVNMISQALGASGVVMGAGAVATCLMPFAPMNLMFIPINIPLWAITCAYFAIDAYYLDSGARVGHAAHLGGTAYGAMFYFAYLRRFGGVWQMVRRGLRR